MTRTNKALARMDRVMKLSGVEIKLVSWGLLATMLAAPGLAREDDENYDPLGPKPPRHQSRTGGSDEIAKNYDWRAVMADGMRRREHKDLVGAEACFRQALRDAKRSGADADDISTCLCNLAGILYAQDIYEDVRKLYRESLHVLEKKYGKDSEKLLPTLAQLGNIDELDGQYKSAVSTYNRAIKILTDAKQQNSLTYAKFVHSLGRTETKQQFPRLAQAHYQVALRVVMNQSSLPGDDFLMEILADYIDSFRKYGEQNRIQTSAFQSELLKDRVTASGKTSGVATSVFSQVMNAELAKKAFEKVDAASSSGTSPGAIGTGATSGGESSIASPSQAIRLDMAGMDASIQPAVGADDLVALQQINRQRVDFYERMIELDIKSLGEDHPSVARDLSGLATIYLTQKKYDQAKPLLERALNIYKRIYGNDAQLVSQTEVLLNYIADDKKSAQMAANFQSDYMSKLVAVPVQAEKLEIALRLNYLALLCYSFGKVEDAREVYQWALADTIHVFGQRSLLAANCMLDYSVFLSRTGNQPEAALIDRDARDIIRFDMERRALQAMP